MPWGTVGTFQTPGILQPGPLSHGTSGEQGTSERGHAPKPGKPKTKKATETFEERAKRCIIELDDKWDGRRWVPPYTRDGQVLTVESLSSKDIIALHSITLLAVKKKMQLPSLFGDDGAIRQAVRNCNSGSDEKKWKWNVTTVAMEILRADTRADNLEGQTALPSEESQDKDDSQQRFTSAASEEVSHMEKEGPPKSTAEQCEHASSPSYGSDNEAQDLDTKGFGSDSTPSPPEAGRNNIKAGFVLGDLADCVGGEHESEALSEAHGISHLGFSSPPLQQRRIDEIQRHQNSTPLDQDTSSLTSSDSDEDTTTFQYMPCPEPPRSPSAPNKKVAKSVISDSDEGRCNILTTEKTLESARLRLESPNEQLDDYTLYYVQKGFQKHFDSQGIEGVHLVDPVYLKIDSSSPPDLHLKRPPKKLTGCVYHDSPPHWTLLVINTIDRHVEWYDPLPGLNRAEKAETWLLQLAEENLPGQEHFKFSELVSVLCLAHLPALLPHYVRSNVCSQLVEGASPARWP